MGFYDSDLFSPLISPVLCGTSFWINSDKSL